MNYPPMTSPEEIPQRFVSGWNNRDVDELVSVFTEDAEFVNVVGLWWHNIKEIRKAHDYGLKVIFKDSTLKIQKVTTKYLSEEIVLIHAKMLLRNQSAHGDVRTPQLRQNLFSFVAKQFNGEWKCVSAHNTDIVPGAETHIVKEDGSIKAANYRSKP